MKIIIDTFYNYDENIFEYDHCKSVIGGSWMGMLHRLSSEKGIEVILGKTYLNKAIFSSRDLILSEGYTSNTEHLINTGATPFVIFSGESPNVDWKFYTILEKHSKRYQHAMVFSGAKDYVYPKTQFHPFYWPNNINDTTLNAGIINSESTNNLVMVISNKKQNSTTTNNWILGIVKSVFLGFITKIIPQLKLKDLYSLRMDAIRYFSNKQYFKLFGKGWNNVGNLSLGEKRAIEKLNPMPVENKYELMSQYTFALCFENCVYPGYVTEKIFDCFFSNCIPVYYGAPDITEYVPENTFIDARLFKNFKLLSDFLETIPAEQISTYRYNINEFLWSAQYLKFTDVAFCEKILSLAAKHSSN